MQYQELKSKISGILPNADFGEDNYGQLIIYTNKMVMEDDVVVDFEEELGECDTCSGTYELASRDGRCGDCGDCSDCCTHEIEEE